MSESPVAAPQSEPIPPTTATTATIKGLAITPLITLVLALVASGGAWFTLERWFPAFNIPDELQNGPLNPDEVFSARVRAANVRADRQNAIFAYVCIGTLAGLLLGAAEGFLQRRWVWAAIGLFVGAIVGALGGASAACSAVEAVAWLGTREGVESLQISIAAHGFGWGVTGASLGLALAMLGRSPQTLAKAAIGGAGAGAIVGALFPMLSAWLLPDANTEVLVPAAGAVRVFWLLLGLGLTSLGIGLVGRERVKPT